jgi:hypothetical protein
VLNWPKVSNQCRSRCGKVKLRRNTEPSRRIWVIVQTAAVVAFLPAAACGGSINLVGDDDVTEDAGATDADRTDLSELCRPKDARHPEGYTCTIFIGVKWDGRNCVDIGSGCECIGADCESRYGTVEECVAAQRPCYPDLGCRAQAVAASTCTACSDDRLLGVAWNGRECVPLFGCVCQGDGCATLFDSEEECAAYHAQCDGTLCLATGGEFFPAGAGFCGFTCGVDDPRTCESPFDSCRCPPGMIFVPGAGCTPDPSCGPRERCLISRGTWHPASECRCGFTCGSENPCAACLDSCDCGPLRNFQPDVGCLWDTACGARERADLCTATGGTWHACGPGEDCPCGDYRCGIPHPVDGCMIPGCDCGPDADFHTVYGCIWDDGCVLGERGAECSGFEAGPSCRPGLVCCAAGCMDPCCGSGGPTCSPGGCALPPA